MVSMRTLFLQDSSRRMSRVHALSMRSPWASTAVEQWAGCLSFGPVWRMHLLKSKNLRVIPSPVPFILQCRGVIRRGLLPKFLKQERGNGPGENSGGPSSETGSPSAASSLGQQPIHSSECVVHPQPLPPSPSRP